MALSIMMEVMANLWPLDPTPRLLHRLYIEYEFGAAYGTGEAERCRLMEEFADEILRESASRANRNKAPLAYRQLRERWRDFAEKKRIHPVAKHNTTSSSTGQQQQPAQKTAKAGGNKGRSGTQQKGTSAKFGGNPVCFLYNSRKAGCPRTAKPGGCDDGRGGIYAHMCNFEQAPGQHCLAAHPRHANH